MPASSSRQQRLVEHLMETLRTSPKNLGEMIGAPYGVETVSPQKEREMYWTEDPAFDVAAMMPQVLGAVRAQAEPDDTDETIHKRVSLLLAHAKYPARANLIRAGERALDVGKQVEFARKMAELGPPGLGGEDDG